MTDTPSVLRKPAATLLIDARNILGEGLLWSVRRQAWLWTDIQGSRLWLHHPASRLTRSWLLPDRMGSLAVCRSGRLLLGLAKGLVWADIDAATGDEVSVIPVVDVEIDRETTRINDGRTDRQGNFVFGTYNEAIDGQPLGHFYQYSTLHGLRPLELDAITCANSIAFSPDGKTMYYCDSPTRRIMRCEYEAEGARTRGAEVFVEFRPEDEGIPDGSVVDGDGALWNAGWGGSALRRFDARGRLTTLIPVPSPHVTCPAFGGPALDELATTTAHWMLSSDQMAAAPRAGGLYTAGRVGAIGIADAEFDDRA